MTQQRSNDDIRTDPAALLDELFPLDRDDEPNEADLSQGVEWWAQTCIWWAKNCRSAWADRDALLARVSELEQENREWEDEYARDVKCAAARAERAEAQRDEALTLLADAVPDPKGAIDSPQWHRRMDALAAGLSLQEEQE